MKIFSLEMGLWAMLSLFSFFFKKTPISFLKLVFW